MIDIHKAVPIQGWMSNEELIWLAERASEVPAGGLIAEVGCWLGRTTRALIDNTKADVHSVDNWKGSPEHVEELKDKPKGWLFNCWCRNVVDRLGHNLHVWALDSLQAAELFRHQGLKFDMIFIDAEHDYNAVKLDIKAWSLVLKPGGLICGHDYGNSWQCVKDAVDEMLPSAKKVDHPRICIWYVPSATNPL